jgi:hypothetical protein
MRKSTNAAVALAVALLSTGARPVLAQTDEIQVYTGELAAPGTASLTVHANYTPRGHTVAAFPGGVVPDGSINGAFEWARGITSWFEAGTYLPVYTITRDHRWQIDGVKLRALFAIPHAEARAFFYGMNFELSYNSPRWDASRYAAEIRPIIGARRGRWDLIVNPILDTSFQGFSRLEFAPATRLAFNVSPRFAVAAEHYANYGELRHFESVRGQEHNVFAVVDYSSAPLDIEAGVGFGLTSSSDKTLCKLILAHTF